MKGLTSAVVPPRSEFLRLRKERPGLRAHDHSIAAIDKAIGVHIGTEVGRIRRLTGAIACLQRVTGIHDSISIGITDQNAHWDNNIAGVSAIAHVTKRKRDSLTSVTPVRSTVICDPLTLKPPTLPVPEVTVAPPAVTGVAKLMII